MAQLKLYSIVIPVYGTSSSLAALAERIKAVFKTLPASDYELIFVNDCSPKSDTEPTLQLIYEKDPNVSVITFGRNFGQQAATLCGIHHARGDFVLTMDDDLQHKPEDIPLLIQEGGHDAVIASFPSKKHGIFKQLASRLKGWFDRIIIKKPKHLQLTSFRLFNRHIVEGIKNSQTPYPFIPAMLFRVTVDVVNVDVQHHDRIDGHSQYTLWKMVRLFSNLLINNSYLLLRALGVIGICGFVLSILFSIYLVIRHLFWGFGVSGWASLILAVIFSSGLILFGMGVIGEYLLRILVNLEYSNMYHIKRIQKHD